MLMKAAPASDLCRFKVDNETSEAGRGACADSITVHCAGSGALHLLSISVGRLGTADYRRGGIVRGSYLYCGTLLHFN